VVKLYQEAFADDLDVFVNTEFRNFFIDAKIDIIIIIDTFPTEFIIILNQ
jgi:hypothetical protein